MKYLEIIIPLPLPGTFTYSFSESLYPNVNIGCRVIVQFGKRKMYTGVIAAIHEETPINYRPKEIIEVVDDFPIITPHQLEFLFWIHSYYMCSIGEVVNAALPAGLKISSESILALNPETDLDDLDLTEKERTIVNHLLSGDIKMSEVNDILDIKSSYAHVKNLKEKKAIQVFELVKDKYTPKTETWVKLDDYYLEEPILDELTESLSSKPKQLDVLVAYLSKVPVFESPNLNGAGMSKKELFINEISTSSYKTLVKNGILNEWDKTISRIGAFDGHSSAEILLSKAQKEAREKILSEFEQHNTVLLHGITGSGKTEIFISLIKDILESGGQVLYLLPEIALTTQIIKRLALIFGDQFAVFHSKYSENERVEVWQKVQSGECNFIVGVRSSIFLPFNDLSLIVVDEEHESSYKQYEPSPRYHARDSAIYLASIFNCKTLLATATPSLETYKNALDGKYGLVSLQERYNNSKIPKVGFANLLTERKQKKIKGNFTSTLLNAIDETVSGGKQVILFQNRRGYAPYVTCLNCGFIPKCPNCDVSLTYHNHSNLIICHYCGHKTENPSHCGQCKSPEIKSIGFGTEKLEEELQALLPEVSIRRMDLDTTRSKYGYQKIIDEFESGAIDILVGTQMVTKGLDFGSVSLVGVFDADRMIHFPDFRSHERAYQLMHQVSGRAGRRAEEGKVIIQTNDPDQALLQFVKSQKYDAFYKSEIAEREIFKYPPFYRMIKVTVKDFDKQIAGNAARYYAQQLTAYLGNHRVIGPVEPIVGKIRNQYLYDITIKFEKQGIKVDALKDFLLTSRNNLISQRLYKSVRVIFDVDPV